MPRSEVSCSPNYPTRRSLSGRGYACACRPTQRRTRRRRVTLKKIIWMGWVLSILVLAASCAGPTIGADPPNILLISIDALRADHLSCYGYDRHTSPVLDGLAAQGTRFSKAFVNTHGTPPSHTTLLSSLYQESHRVGIETDLLTGRGVPVAVAMVQEIFAEAGWHTIAVTGGGYMSSEVDLR